MWVKVIILNTLLVGFALSDNLSKCDLSEVNESAWEFSLSQTAYDNVNVNDNLFVSAYTGKLESLSSKCQCGGTSCLGDYLKFSTNGSHFFMTFTEAMKTFDEDMIKLTCKGSLVYTIYMTCQTADQSSLLLLLQVNDYNEYPPEISHGNTTYKVASPVMPMSDVIIYGDKISATDKDFNNTAIDFKVSPDDFDVITTEDSSTNPSTFYATFRAKRLIRLTETATKYTITATDNGIYPGTLTSDPLDIFLVIDKETSMDIPTFVYPTDSSSYSFEYKDGKITGLNGQINVDTTKTKVSLSLSGDLSDHFKAIFNPATSEIEISVATKVDNPPSPYIILTLTLKTDTTVTTPILIYFTDVPDVTGLKFSQHLYIGNYDESKNAVDLKEKITVTTTRTGKLTVTINGGADDFDVTKYFELTKNYEVTVLKPLTQEILQKQKRLVLTLEAELDSSTTFATLVVELPLPPSAAVVKFENPLYNGEYKVAVDGTVTFTVDTAVIVSDEDAANIDVVISEDSIYGKYFDVPTSKKSVQLVTKSALPKDVYTKETVIPIVLVATVKGGTTKASTVVDIKINYDSYLGSVQFDNLLYNGKYETKKKIVTVQVDTIKLITDKPDQIDVAVTNVYKEYFEAKYSSASSEVTITTIKNIPDSVLNDISTVSILLSASIKNTKVSSNSVVNLRIINDDIPDPDVAGTIAFDTVSNTAEYYIENNKGVLKIDKTIGVTTDRMTNEIETKITDDMGLSGYFSSSYDGSVFSVKLEKDLPENIFLSNAFISLTLTATIKETNQKASAVLTIKFDNDQEADTGHISFKSIVYNGVYEIDKDVASIVDIDNIVIDTDADDTNVSVTILNDMDKFFKANYFNKVVTLSLTTSAASATLRSQNNIAVVLQANIKNTLIATETVVNLKVKDKNNTGLSGTNSDNTPYIIAVSFLSVFILLLIIAAILFYYFKLRNSNYEKMSEEEYVNRNSKVKFDKTATRQSGDTLKRSSAIEQRRPTGFIFKSNEKSDVEEPEESYTDTGNENKERKKSVVFDDNVEKLQIQLADDDDVDIEKATDQVEA